MGLCPVRLSLNLEPLRGSDKPDVAMEQGHVAATFGPKMQKDIIFRTIWTVFHFEPGYLTAPETGNNALIDKNSDLSHIPAQAYKMHGLARYESQAQLQ